jgi:cephalosporin hydroxylase
LSYDDYLAFYQGIVNTVAVNDWQGRVIHFPANILKPYLTHSGIHGHFKIDFSDENKFMGIEQL